MIIRILAAIKVIFILLIDFVLINYMLNIEIAIIVTIGIMLYAWIGEYIGLFKDKAISLKNLGEYEKTKLLRAYSYLIKDVKRIKKIDISKLKLHVIPSEDIDACCYGSNNIAITRSGPNACDNITIAAVLGHEISHLLNLDAIINRLIFANITLVLAAIGVISFFSISFIWLIFILLCLSHICGNVLSIYIFNGINKILKGIFTLAQHLILFFYQITIGFINRSIEFRCDKFSCQLGYASELNYFLTRFIEGQETYPKSLNKILYSSHPATNKRVIRIENYCISNK